ncbi:Rv0909 family putative TA system antitoxin [Microbacterium sp. W1N]|uniref:Rv0909 family putative TA system antitoxin n=1 Tax=Microbacterium festucae TaxID=2977531 RepID=UPI0021C05B50|nr:Rv0909 family putative TA system antitoxin [Microbacterium festucae]MCT9819100.1 Rv0909 family putative TA system antitoxin [Microbacterium festucae]
MGVEDVVNQAKQFLEQNKDKIDETLTSEQAEGVSDSVLDAAADFVKKVAPDAVDEHVDNVRNTIDSKIGHE